MKSPHWIKKVPSRWIILLILLLAVGGLTWAMVKHRSGSRVLVPAEPELIVSSGTIAHGGSLYQTLVDNGFSITDSVQMVQAFSQVFDPRNSHPGDLFEILRNPQGQFQQLVYWTDAANYFTLSKDSDTYRAEKKELPLTKTVLGTAGTLKSTLWESMTAQGISPELIYEFADLFSWQVDFLTEPRNGDTFKVIWKQETGRGGSVVGRTILAAVYNGKEAGLVDGYRFKNEYFMSNGESLRRAFLRAPLNYRRISSYFSKRRWQPVLKIYRPHHGIDYAAAHGTPVSSIGAGTVVFRGWKGGYGNLVAIRHSSSYETRYGHLSRFGNGVRVGSRVAQGQVIGYVGSTGFSTGPHLHFEVRRGNSPINFFTMKFPSVKKISGEELSQFSTVKEGLDQLWQELDARLESTPSRPITLSEENPAS